MVYYGGIPRECERVRGESEVIRMTVKNLTEATAKQRWYIGHLLFDNPDPRAGFIVGKINERLVGSGNKEQSFCSESLKFMPPAMASAVIDSLRAEKYSVAAILLFDYLNIDYDKRAIVER
jgi:hypothetical protein